jgi:hypothetical protein
VEATYVYSSVNPLVYADPSGLGRVLVNPTHKSPRATTPSADRAIDSTSCNDAAAAEAAILPEAAQQAWWEGRADGCASTGTRVKDFLVEHRDEVNHLLFTALAGLSCFHMIELAIETAGFGPVLASAFALGAAVTCAQEIPKWGEHH